MINYAHRGASERAPENTFSAFYLGLELGANGIETDIQETADGILVLFHDHTLKRITGLEMPVQSLTYTELLRLDFGSHKGQRYQNEKIVTLEDFLRYFSGRPVHLALEIKQDGIEPWSAAQLLPTASYAVLRSTFWTTNPVTNAAWTEDDLNELQVGIRIP